MKFDFLSGASDKELQQFKSVCNQLLSRTYVVRTLYRPGRERLNNPDYTFLTIHAEAVRDYLSLLDWDLRHDDANGIYYVVNTDDANRCILSSARPPFFWRCGCCTTKAWRVWALRRTRSARCARCSKRS